MSVLSPAALARALPGLRRGKTVVFANGCFDLLHPGHVKVLEWAKRQGDLLIAAVNADASVRRLKGPRRPILPLKDRLAMIAALKAVDVATWFSEDTPVDLIKRLRPDVLVKGAGPIVGRELVKKAVSVPLLKGRSTTGIVEAVLKRYAAK